MSERTFWTWRTVRAQDLRPGDIVRGQDGVGDVVAKVTPHERDARMVRVDFHERASFSSARNYELTPAYNLFAIQVEERN